MAEGDLKLLGAWPSPYVIRVKMVLEQKGLSYEYFEQDLLIKSKLLLDHNPIHMKVPVLIHGNRSICELLVVLQYIDENWSGNNNGPPLLPADSYKRAITCFWTTYVDGKFAQSIIGILKAVTEERKAEKMVDSFGMLEQLEGVLKKCSGGTGKGFFGGDSIDFLDVILGSELAWIKAVENICEVKFFNETKVPLLVEWKKRFLAVDFVKKALPSVESVKGYAEYCFKPQDGKLLLESLEAEERISSMKLRQTHMKFNKLIGKLAFCPCVNEIRHTYKINGSRNLHFSILLEAT